MSSLARLMPAASRLRAVVAAGCAGLVLALTVFAASPRAHEWLHDADHHHHDEGDAGCAVVLLAGGVSLPVGPVALTPPVAIACDQPTLAATDVLLVSPRYLFQPERGPPAPGKA
ncbi:MAG: hypothetical protein Q8N18_09860 [Opitutaceae bacterium]|nr:hypothetical protein [Opitutaceae bacterium]